MDSIGIVGLLLIIVTTYISYNGIRYPDYFEKYKFEVDQILINKDYKRMISSGFLHTSWMHLIFNMVSLYNFSDAIEFSLGPINFLIIYFISLIGGNLFSLFIHRNHGNYSAAGASGAVCGIIFASIAIHPDMSVGMLFLPLHIPAWAYGLAFVIISIYAIRLDSSNIAHDAHLAGALAGMSTALIIYPYSLLDNYITILIIFIPSLAFIIYTIYKPSSLIISNGFHQKGYYTLEDKYNLKKQKEEAEIDKILEKISKKGFDSLSEKEKDRLNKYSKS